MNNLIKKLYNEFIELNLLSMQFELLDKNHFLVYFIFEKVSEANYLKAIKKHYNKETMKKLETIIYEGLNIDKLLEIMEEYNEKEI